MSRHRPSDEPSPVSVQHERHIEETFLGFYVSYVRNPQAIGRSGGEVSADEIRGGHGTPIPASGSPSSATKAALQSCFAHQPRATRLRPQRMPIARNSACTRG
jgi:hypothetical protein